MNVVDSSAWLEYFEDGVLAAEFARIVETNNSLIVPTITIYEVHKRISTQRSEKEAMIATRLMEEGLVIPLDIRIALAASEISRKHKLHMADSIIYATAREHGAVIWTMDAHFSGMPGVEYRAKVYKA